MAKIRVLVVDDAVVVRRLVAQTLAEDPDIEVVGVAANGRIALARIPQLNPDVITLDVEMPEMDGLTTLVEVRKIWPRLPVIMFSTLTERGATATLDALSLGASDYVTKPSGVSAPGEALDRIREDLVPRIKALCPPPATYSPPVPATAPASPAAARASAAAVATAVPATPIDVITIGVSTGGPNALSDLLPLLPATFPVPVLIVQHMPPMFTRFLAERLDSRCPLTVVEAEAGQIVRPGGVYIAPGGFHMVVERRGTDVVIDLNEGPMENSCRPAVDVLFRSVAQVYGPGALAVILTGMGQDGLHGSRVVLDAGGRLIAQDEASSVVWGMPGFVAKAGLPEAVLPLDAMADAICQRVNARRAQLTGSGERR